MNCTNPTPSTDQDPFEQVARELARHLAGNHEYLKSIERKLLIEKQLYMMDCIQIAEAVNIAASTELPVEDACELVKAKHPEFFRREIRTLKPRGYYIAHESKPVNLWKVFALIIVAAAIVGGAYYTLFWILD